MNRARAATFPSSRVGVVPVRVCWGLRPVHPRLTPRARVEGGAAQRHYLTLKPKKFILPSLPSVLALLSFLPPSVGPPRAPLLSSLGVSENGVSHAFGKFREISQNISYDSACCVTERAASSLPNSTGSVLETYSHLGVGETPHRQHRSRRDGNNENSRQAAAQERKQDLDFDTS